MSTVTGKKLETPEEYRKLVATFIEKIPNIVNLWERNAKKKGATEHEIKLAKYGREHLAK